MYDVNDTICAAATVGVGAGEVARTIVRVSGDDAFAAVGELFVPDGFLRWGGLNAGAILLGDGLRVEVDLYVFCGPRSYTGEDLVELHFFAAGCVVECVLAKLCERVRLAGPGEFTLRAYLNGRIDLSQAEAVAQIVAGSNAFQINAAQKLLAGRLADTAAGLRGRILDLLSLMEAGMDFSEEDIEFVTAEKAVEAINRIRGGLEELSAGAIGDEEMIDLPSVGLGGAANAGKSSLLNALLGSERSIVSPQRATTRDVLTGVLEMEKARCMIFDCAGLGVAADTVGLADRLGAEAAEAALNSADVVVLCVDGDKADYAEDVEIKEKIASGRYLLAMTKADLLGGNEIDRKAAVADAFFGCEPIVTSAHTEGGVEQLKQCIEREVVSITAPATEAGDRLAINQRHKKLVAEAVEHLSEATEEAGRGNDEIAAMLLRSACGKLSGLEKEDIDEAVLERIFSNFCIGK